MSAYHNANLNTSLPNNQTLESKVRIEAFADDRINVTKKKKNDFGWIINIVRKGENAGYQHFLIPACFSGS